MSTFFVVYLKGFEGDNSGMDSKEIRYRNTLLLVAEAGGVTALGNRIGKVQSQVNQFAGSRPTKGIGGKIARQIEEAFGRPNGWLDHPHPELWGATEPERPAPPKDGTPNYVLSGVEEWDDDTPLGPDEVYVPLLKEVELAGGNGSSAHTIEESTRKLRFSKATLRNSGVQKENVACVPVKGNSMERLIMNGATVGVDVSRKQILDGEIYAFDHDGLLRVKYLYRLPGGKLRVRSENMDEHQDEVYSAEEWAQSIRIIGWVFWWSTIRRWKGS